MSEAVSYPPRRGVLRQAAYVSACEALTWIAFGEAMINADIKRAGAQTLERWGSYEPSYLLAALEAARTRSGPVVPRSGYDEALGDVRARGR
jgi:hypothetical protein